MTRALRSGMLARPMAPAGTDATRRMRALTIIDPDRARKEIVAAIKRHGSRPAAAEALGISERTLYRLLLDLEIDAPHGQPGRPRKQRREP